MAAGMEVPWGMPSKGGRGVWVPAEAVIAEPQTNMKNQHEKGENQ